MFNSRLTGPDSSATAQSPLRPLQFVVLAIVMGALTLLAIVMFVAGAPVPGPQRLLAQIGLVFATIALVARFGFQLISDQRAVRAARDMDLPERARTNSSDFTRLTDAGAPSAEAQALMPHFHTRVVVSTALVEGAVFFNLIAYMIERHSYNLVVAVVLVAYIVMHWPTALSYVNWVARIVDQAARLAD